jgi:ribosome-binding protein aMBF1 (putative translation factor)
MAGHRSFQELRKSIPQERRERNRRETRALLKALALFELRQARGVSQEEMASELSVQQPAVAKMERREDIYVSNLRRYVEALGGRLEITAHFPDAVVPISLGSDPAE